MVSCGQSHSAAVNSHGELLIWGDGYSGALGTGDDETAMSPCLLGAVLFAGEQVLMVACGDDYTAAVTVVFELWT